MSISKGLVALAGVALALPYVAAAIPEHVPLVAVSGLCGGVCRWVAAQEKIWPNGLSSIIVGLLGATFLWPVAEPIMEPMIGRLEMDPEVGVMFGGFVTGLLGLTLIQFILDFGRARRKEGFDASHNE